MTPDPSDHEAVLLAVVGHEDDVAVGGPDEAGQFEGVLGSGRRRLDRRNLIGFDAAQLRSRVQHPDAAQQRRVHLPEGDVAVSVGVGGQISSVRCEGHRRYGSFMSMNVLAFSSANVIKSH